ncbi:MAG: thiamine pyrophosphate-dependent enzyme, partial [Candidatus Nanoarchaeia archaeon]
MPEKVIQKFEIKYLEVLDKDGNVDLKLKPKVSDKEVIQMYKQMVLARNFDNKMLSLQRQGKISTFAQGKGHEALQVAAGFAMKKEDWLVPYFREQAISIVRGVPLENILMYYGGDERGSIYKKGVNVLPVCIPVATQLLHGAGLAWAFKKQKKKSVVVAFCGDGATSEGDFHEALNFASVFQV